MRRALGLLARGVASASFVGLVLLAPRTSLAVTPSSPPLDARAATLAAVRTSLTTPCLVLWATLSGSASHGVVLESVGTYDPLAGVGDFWSLVRGTDMTDLLLVRTVHADGLVHVAAIVDLTHGTFRPGFTATPSEMVHGVSVGGPAYGRLGRYQPGSAIALLAGIEPSSIDPTTTPGVVDVVVDLDAAAAVAPQRTGVRDAVDAIATRQFRGRLEIGGPPWMVRSIDYRMDVPSGAGEPAHQATWSIRVAPVGHEACPWSVHDGGRPSSRTPR